MSAKRAVAAVHRDRRHGSSFSDEHPSTGSPETKKDGVAAEFDLGTSVLDDSVGNLNSVVRPPTKTWEQGAGAFDLRLNWIIYPVFFLCAHHLGTFFWLKLESHIQTHPHTEFDPA